MTEQLKFLASAAHTDQRVRKRLLSVTAGWHRQYKDDPNQYMRALAGIYASCKPPSATAHNAHLESELSSIGIGNADRERKAKEREEREARDAERKKAKALDKQREKDKLAAAASAPWNQKKPPNKQRKPFNFEQEKPQILSSIASASQASNNLINALKLVNREKESIEQNERVQETLAAAKAARKGVVRYVQVCDMVALVAMALSLTTFHPISLWRTKS